MFDTVGTRKVPEIPVMAEFAAEIKELGDKIVALTEQEQKAITDLQNLGAKVRITAIKDNREKSLAEIDQWYKEEKQKAEGSAAVIVEIEKVKGEKLIAFDAWWTDELTKAATDRAKMLADIQAGLMERAAEKKEGEDAKMKGMVTKDELTKSISAAVKVICFSRRPSASHCRSSESRRSAKTSRASSQISSSPIIPPSSPAPHRARRRPAPRVRPAPGRGAPRSPPR